jgi:hypothetical protein
LTQSAGSRRTARAAVELPEVDASGRALFLQQQRDDQEPGQDEEAVDDRQEALNPVTRRVAQHDDCDAEPPEPVERGDETEFRRDRSKSG